MVSLLDMVKAVTPVRSTLWAAGVSWNDCTDISASLTTPESIRESTQKPGSAVAITALDQTAAGHFSCLFRDHRSAVYEQSVAGALANSLIH